MCQKDFTAKDGKRYQIKIDDEGTQISVHLSGTMLGTIELTHKEEGEVEKGGCYEWFHITNLSLDKCKFKGIGRECLIFHKESFGIPITAGKSDGSKSEDGSHLTGDGVGFIDKMRKEGVVEPCTDHDSRGYSNDLVDDSYGFL